MCTKCNHAQQSSARKAKPAPLFVTHNDTTINTDGTTLQGYVETTNDKLYAAFGESRPHPDWGEFVREWVLLFEDGTVARVQTGSSMEIHGYNYRAVDLVKQALKG